MKTLKMTDEEYNNLLAILALPNGGRGLGYYVEERKKGLPKKIRKDVDDLKGILFTKDDSFDDIIKKIFHRYGSTWLYYGSYHNSYFGHKDFTDSLVSILNDDIELANRLYEEFYVSKTMKYGRKHQDLKAYIASVLIRTNHPVDKLLTNYIFKVSRYSRAWRQKDLFRLYVKERGLYKDIQLMTRAANLSNIKLKEVAVELADKSILPYFVNITNPHIRKFIENRMSSGV